MKTFKKTAIFFNLFLLASLFAQSQVSPPPGLRQELRRFYKIDKVYKFIVPGTSTTSNKISIYWDSAQAAHYTVKIIKRDSANEQSHIAFVPEFTIDTVNATILPQPKAVKITTLLLYDDGSLHPQEWVRCPCYCWVCHMGAVPALYSYVTMAWYCPTFPDLPNLYICGNGFPIGHDTITWMEWE